MKKIVKSLPIIGNWLQKLNNLNERTDWVSRLLKNKFSLTSVVIGLVMTVSQTASANSFLQFDTCMDEAAIRQYAKLDGISQASARSSYELDMNNRRTSQKRLINLVYAVVQKNIYKQNFPQTLSDLYSLMDENSDGHDLSAQKRCIANLATSLRR